MRVRRLPRDDATCGWTALLPPLPPARRLVGAQRADCAIVGAGYTGLAAARRLAEQRPAWRIAVLDAQRVGDGASGRNSGFVVDLPHVDPHRSPEEDRRLVRLGRAGLTLLRDLVGAQGIACDWRDGGRLHGAAGAEGARALDAFVDALGALGEPVERLDAEALAALIGSRYYRAGARTYGGATVQPAALVRGLAATLPPSVELFESSPARTLTGSGPIDIGSDAGTLRAERVLLATDGYSAAFGGLRRQVLPLMTFASLTRPLTAAEAVALGGLSEWGLVSEAPMGTTLRRLRDGRLLIRNTVRYAPRLDCAAALRLRVRGRHRAGLAARFPSLAAVELEYSWGGIMGASYNGAQCFGALAPGCFVAAGYNGVGIAMGTISGHLLADLVVGADSPLLADMRALPAVRRMPPQPALGIGVRVTLALLSRRGRGE